jgi:hypothetical protein
MTTETDTDTAGSLLAGLTDADGRLDLGADPAAAERLGAMLAAVLRDVAPVAVVSWDDDVEDVVLAHVVARELGVPARRATLDLGRLAITGSDVAGAVVAVVATTFRGWQHGAGPLAVGLQTAGACSVVAAQLLAADDAVGTGEESVPVRTLVQP